MMCQFTSHVKLKQLSCVPFFTLKMSSTCFFFMVVCCGVQETRKKLAVIPLHFVAVCYDILYSVEDMNR